MGLGFGLGLGLSCHLRVGGARLGGDQVGLALALARAQQAVDDLAVGGEQQQARALGIEPPDRVDAVGDACLGLGAGVALGLG